MHTDTQYLVALGAAYFLVANMATYLTFAWDKRQAKRRKWRISENTLLALALIGGSPAAKLAQRRLRHKTRKQPFARLLWLIILIQIAACLAVMFPRELRGLLGL